MFLATCAGRRVGEEFGSLGGGILCQLATRTVVSSGATRLVMHEFIESPPQDAIGTLRWNLTVNRYRISLASILDRNRQCV